MGVLVAKAYPTVIALKKADHTFVECGNGGHAWGCWGGTSGPGTRQIGKGPGSTARANAIAEPNERGGITCYGINGVCHQAANRILFPARILVTKAKGYWVSQALYTTYGRPGPFLGLCRAPFNRHSGVRGDLGACATGSASSVNPESEERRTMRLHSAAAIRMYEGRGQLFARRRPNPRAVEEFQMSAFGMMVRRRMRENPLHKTKHGAVMEVRQNIERARLELERSFERLDGRSWRSFARSFDKLTIKFQEELANWLTAREYKRLFNLRRDEHLTLLDTKLRPW